jgi:hypothetical protein
LDAAIQVKGPQALVEQLMEVVSEHLDKRMPKQRKSAA